MNKLQSQIVENNYLLLIFINFVYDFHIES